MPKNRAQNSRMPETSLKRPTRQKARVKMEKTNKTSKTRRIRKRRMSGTKHWLLHPPFQRSIESAIEI